MPYLSSKSSISPTLHKELKCLCPQYALVGTVPTTFYVTWTPVTSLPFPMLFLPPRWFRFFSGFSPHLVSRQLLSNLLGSCPEDRADGSQLVFRSISPFIPVLDHLGQRLGIPDFLITVPCSMGSECTLVMAHVIYYMHFCQVTLAPLCG